MRYLFLCIAAMCSMGAMAQLSPEAMREQKHEERVKQREVRTAEYVKHVDSIVLSHSYSFNPSTFQQQPAGSMRLIYNTSFTVGVYPDFVDIYIPYIKGITPPYFLTVINYTIVSPQGYIAVQTDHGWTISFKTNLYSVNNYTFTFNIYSATGEVTLDLSSDIYNTVTYSGSLIGHY